jgi:hypothetical protein
MKSTIAAALLFITGFATAQNTNTNTAPAAPNPQAQALTKDIHADKAAIAADKGAIKQDWSAQKAQIKDLDSQEKAAAAGIRADSTKTKEQKEAALKALHADYKGKKDAIRDQMKTDRKSKRSDIQQKRTDIHQDRVERHDLKK